MRDDFPSSIKDVLARRVGCRCCNPDCCKLASGPHQESTKAVKIGVAAHITAAALGGKRYDPNLSSEERKAIENGIWLCQNCGKLIDSDEQKYSVELLRNWKRNAEQQASVEVETRTIQPFSYSSSKFEQYLKNLVDTPRSWWLDEINESTWYEFELFTKDQEESEPLGEKPKDVLKPILKAIRDTNKQSILIAGAPGSGKSTLLEKLALEAASTAQNNCDAPIPVLVSLKDYEASGERPGIRGLIQFALEIYDPSLDTKAMNQLLESQKILLLIDGWNELSDEKAKSNIKTFCKPHSVIVASRNVGDYWEIQEKFEIQSLSRTAVKHFFARRLPNTQLAKLQELVDRVSDFGQTPLMVWMLFSIFCDDGSIPKTRGETYRAFTKAYAKRSKAGIDLDNARKLLGKLAFEMMKSPKPKDSTDFRLKVSEVEAEEIFGSEAELDRMLNHLLKQQGRLGIREISFCHQSLQEYYAAEHLLTQLRQPPEWPEKEYGQSYTQFQREYLNYLKWTEPIALMLGLVSDEAVALDIVGQALDVDWRLGARLAGVVKPEFHAQTVELVEKLEVPDWLKVRLLGETRSEVAIPELLPFLNHSNIDIAEVAASYMGKTQNQETIAILTKRLEEISNQFFSRQAFAFPNTTGILWSTHVRALSYIAPQVAAQFLREKLQEHGTLLLTTTQAAPILMKLDAENLIPTLLEELRSIQNKENEKKIAANPKASKEEIRTPNLENLKTRIDAAFQVLGLTDKFYQRNYILNLLESSSNYELFIADLIQIFEQEPDQHLQKQMIQILGQSKRDDAIRFLVRKLEEDSSSLREEAAKQLIQLKKIDNREALEELRNLATHKDWNVSWWAAVVLGHLREPVILPRMMDELGNHPESSIRSDAARVLGIIGDSNCIPSLLKTIDQDSDRYVRIEAACALSYFGQEKAIPTLLDVLKSPTGADPYVEIMQSIARFNIEKPLLEVIRSRSSYWQRAAIELSKLAKTQGSGESEILSDLFEALVDPGHESSSEIIDLLSKLADSGTLNRLIEALEHPKNHTNEIYFPNRIALVLVRCRPEMIADKLPALSNSHKTRNIPQLSWLIPTIQSNCKYYNYEIFQAHLAAQNADRQNHPNSDRSSPTIYNIDQVGILNTGTVNIHGDQIGGQNS